MSNRRQHQIAMHVNDLASANNHAIAPPSLTADRLPLYSLLLLDRFMNPILARFLVVNIACFALAASAQEAVESTDATAEPKPLEQSDDAASTAKPKTQSGETSRRDIQDSMTADDFKSAGLDKLSAEELKNLNGWLQGYRQKAETKAAEKATEEVTKKVAESRTQMDNTLSRVDGTFTGLTGRTIIKLEDGSLWKQSNVDDRYRAQVTDRPPVKVTHTAFGYKMRIVGTGEFYVDPVRVKK